jgi:valyl-tRNA synthetase
MNRDRYILSRLDAAARECNQCLQDYEFGKLTQVCNVMVSGWSGGWDTCQGCGMWSSGRTNPPPPALFLLLPPQHNTHTHEHKQVLHTFWLYELCDVYLELIKPVVGDASPANSEARWVAQVSFVFSPVGPFA